MSVLRKDTQIEVTSVLVQLSTGTPGTVGHPASYSQRVVYNRVSAGQSANLSSSSRPAASPNINHATRSSCGGQDPWKLAFPQSTDTELANLKASTRYTSSFGNPVYTFPNGDYLALWNGENGIDLYLFSGFTDPNTRPTQSNVNSPYYRARYDTPICAAIDSGTYDTDFYHSHPDIMANVSNACIWEQQAYEQMQANKQRTDEMLNGLKAQVQEMLSKYYRTKTI